MHLVPFTTLLNIYRSLIEPYISYGLVAWGQAANIYLNKIFILRKPVLRLMHFSDYANLTLFLVLLVPNLTSKIALFEIGFLFVHDAGNQRAPLNISNLFIRSEKFHPYVRATRFSQA